MRKKIIIAVSIVLSFFVGASGMYLLIRYLPIDTATVIKDTRNFNIKESDIISASIAKIYDAVVVVETSNGNQIVGSGTGFIYKTDDKYAYVLTNNHVVSGGNNVIVTFQSDKTSEATVLGSDSYADLAVLRISKENKATVLGIVNAVGSTIAREADITIYTHAGPEIAVATTKGYTTQVATFACLVINAMKQKNIKYDFTLENEYNNIDNIIKSVIDKTNEYKDIAKILSNRNDIFFIGRGNDYNMCMEGSLKLKEISYIHSEAYPAGELKHGTISLIEEGTPVIAIATDKQLYEKTVSNIKETKARGAFTIFITTEEFKDTYTKDFADITLFLPTTSLFNEAIIIVTALQLIAYETAKLRRCDIDKPKNLAKSVTVE